MPATDIAYMSAADIAALIRARKLSATEVMKATLARAAKAQPFLNCFITICADEALRDAAEADAKQARGDPLGPLHGVPLHVKDLVNTAGVRTTFGSLIHEHNVPAADQISIARLKTAGAILFAKTTTPEFGHMCWTEAPLFGRTANAWDATRTSAGSSGGAAVACAAGIGPLAVATDAGGSTRIPAAANGLVGFKQSIGLVPHDTAPDAFSNMSYITPMTRTVMDTALMLEAMAGWHPSDPHSYGMSAAGSVDAASAVGDLKGTRIAWRPYLANTVVDTEYLALCHDAAEALGDLGAVVEPMGDDLEPTEPFWLTLSTALWNARFADVVPHWRDRMSRTLIEQMERGTDARAEDVGRALMLRTRLYRQVQAWFERFDVIVMPSLSRTALGIDEALFEPIVIENRKVDTVRRAWYPYTHPFNLTGNPAVVLPAGMHSDGLPVSIQLVGRRGEDQRLLRVAALFEAARPWAHIRPSLPEVDGRA
ncbi:MAG: amidase [Hyphomicrobiaceae bacterium]|nr:amidase [Hyphomicrobiaceae bacterium]